LKKRRIKYIFSVGDFIKYSHGITYIINIKDSTFLKIHYPEKTSDWDRYFPLDDPNLSNLPEQIEIGKKCFVDFSDVFYEVSIVEVYTGVMLKLHMMYTNKDKDFWVKLNDKKIRKWKEESKSKIKR
jgi:hypothetical protein